MVREFIDRVFNGSLNLCWSLVEDQRLTENDLEEMRRTIKAPPEVQMTASLLLDNLLAWSAQIGVLVAIGALAGLTLKHPRAVWCSGRLLAIALVLRRSSRGAGPRLTRTEQCRSRQARPLSSTPRRHDRHPVAP